MLTLLHLLQACPTGPNNITPLHMAALAAGGGTMAQLLADAACSMLGSGAANLWFSASTTGGASPADFAAAAGRGKLNDEMQQRVRMAANACELTMLLKCQCKVRCPGLVLIIV